MYNLRKGILYTARTVTMTQNCCSRYSPYTLTEWSFRHGGNGNWFVSIAGGATAFLGTPLGCEDLFGRLKPSYSLALGKWFTPWVGARINYNGLQFKDGTLAVQEYHYLHADLLWNVLGGSYVRQKLVRWHLAPFAGIGLLHHATNGHNPFAISYGIQGQYRISKG